MPNMSNISKGIQILLKYVEEDASLSAEHGVIYGPHVPAMSNEDAIQMDELGWYQDTLEEDDHNLDLWWSAFT